MGNIIRGRISADGHEKGGLRYYVSQIKTKCCSLLKATVRIVPMNKCNGAFGYSGRLTESMICAGAWPLGGVDTCQVIKTRSSTLQVIKVKLIYSGRFRRSALVQERRQLGAVRRRLVRQGVRLPSQAGRLRRHKR